MLAGESTVTGTPQLTTTDSEQALMSDLSQQPVSIAIGAPCGGDKHCVVDRGNSKKTMELAVPLAMEHVEETPVEKFTDRRRCRIGKS